MIAYIVASAQTMIAKTQTTTATSGNGSTNNI